MIADSVIGVRDPASPNSAKGLGHPEHPAIGVALAFGGGTAGDSRDTTIVGSRRISWASASLSAWRIDFCGIALSLIRDVDVAEQSPRLVAEPP